jgi:aconitate hydratase
MDLTALTQTFPLGSGGTGRLVSLPALAAAGFGDTATLPVSLRIVLESVLRNCDGKRITEDDVRRLAQWEPTAERTAEIPFVVARVLLQDFTGVPLLCDLAAMRSALERMGRDPALIEPLVPVDLVIDHSVQVDFTGRERNLPTLGGNGLGGNGTPADPLTLNMQLEFERNRERYEFLKWGMQAFRTFRVIPPGIGICHQVNLEYLAQGVLSRDDLYFPDTLVGTDSHTTMINGLGIVGWGVGGIEAEAAMLGQPVSFLTPDVVGVNLKGCLREGVTATDLVLTVTEMLRKAGVVGKFVEFHGEGAAELSVPDRATIANMAPEYGATMGFFPVDEKTCAYLLATGRSPEHVATVRNYFEAQGMFGIPAAGACRYSTVLELDLATVEASVAGPKRPQDRIAVGRLAPAFGESLQKPVREGGLGLHPMRLPHVMP